MFKLFLPGFAFFSFLAAPLAGAGPLALVYSGPGACEENCAQAAAAVAQRAGFEVKYVTPGEIESDLLHKAAVWIQPGGDAIAVANAVSDDKKLLLRAFVHAGGGYLGFCAGAFFSDSTVDDANTIRGLGLIPGTTHDYKTPGKAAVLPLNWEGRIRYVYFEEGASFEFAPNAPVHVLAYYSTGEPAAIATRFGAGHVVVSGPHPEAPTEWAESHQLPDPDGPDFDLAEQMFRLATRTLR